MSTVVNLNTAVAHKVVFELKYDGGYAIWDRGGRVCNALLQTEEEWTVSAADANIVQMVSEELNLKFNFGVNKLDLAQQQTFRFPTLMDIPDFARIADAVTEAVVTGLQLESFQRIGFRFWEMFPTESVDEMNDALRRLSLFRALPQALSHATDLGIQSVVSRPANMLRLNVNSFEQTANIPPATYHAAQTNTREMDIDQKAAYLKKMRAQKMIDRFPKCGILVDLDAFIDFPPGSEALRVIDFVHTAASDFREIVKEVLKEA